MVKKPRKKVGSGKRGTSAGERIKRKNDPEKRISDETEAIERARRHLLQSKKRKKENGGENKTTIHVHAKQKVTPQQANPSQEPAPSSAILSYPLAPQLS